MGRKEEPDHSEVQENNIYDYIWRKIKISETEKPSHTETAVGFSEESADVRIAQYESNQRTPKEETVKRLARELCVPVEILTVPVLSEPKEYSAAFFWMHELHLNYNCGLLQ